MKYKKDDVIYLGKININKFSKNDYSDELIITTKQIQHIKLKHPFIYEKYYEKFLSIVNNPDYIFEDNRNKDTILVCKCINKKNNSIIIVIKLVLKENIDDYKSSIITAFEIKTKRLEGHKKTNKVIYNKDIL